jgi:hypothetical protein
MPIDQTIVLQKGVKNGIVAKWQGSNLNFSLLSRSEFMFNKIPVYYYRKMVNISSLITYDDNT